jgi:hypothetical protein
MLNILVADTNVLRHPGLRKYFRLSRENCIAISDLTMIEMRKTNALSTTRDSLQIVSAFPAQTFLLRRTDEVLEERISEDEHVSRLIDYRGTIDLETLCRELQILPTPAALKVWMAEEQARAQRQMALLQDEVRPLEPGLVDAATEFSAAELAQIRSGKGVGSRAQEKLLTLLKETTADFIRRNQQPSRTAPMSFTEARAMFAMRYSLCMIIYYIKWVQVGRQTGKKLERRVNDVVDMQLAAMGTYFNGVMSLDKDLQFVSKAARDVLRHFGAFVGWDWTLPPGYREPQVQ